MRLKQYLCACSVTLLTTTYFMHISWPSPTIPLLTSPNSPIGVQLSKEEASWVASVKSLGMLPGAFAVGILMDKIGRRKTLLLSGLLLFISWIIIIFAKSFPVLLVAQIIGGFASAAIAGVVSIYLGEISEKDIRGRLNTIPSLGGVVAAIVVLGVGPFVSYAVLATICSITPVLFCITFYAMPESPYFLVKTNRRQAAYEALNGLSKTADIDAWLNEIETTVQQDEECKLTVKQLLVKVNHRKAFLIVIAMKSLQQFSGLFAINSYLQTIMEESRTSLSADISSVIFAVIQIPCVIISAYLVDKVGRRPLLVVSAAGCALALLGEGIYFYLLQELNLDLTSVYFLPTFCLTLYFIMQSVGVGNLLYVVSGELFTTNVKKVGGSVFAFYSGLLSFVSLKIFNSISETYGMYTMFWIFGCVCILGVLFGLFVLPETKGKSFDEIQDLLHGKRNKVSPLPLEGTVL